jgi:ATP-dependent Lon protease
MTKPVQSLHGTRPRAQEDAPSDKTRLVKTLQEGGLIILPVRRMVLFPGASVPIAVGRPRSVAAVDMAIGSDQPIGVIMQKEAETNEPGADDLYHVGTLARIVQHQPAANGARHLVCEGIERIRITGYRSGMPFLVATFEPIEEAQAHGAEIDARFLQLKERALEVLNLLDGIPQEFVIAVASIEDPSQLANMVAQHIDLESQEKQEILETVDLGDRLDRMIEILGYRIEVLKLSRDISQQTRERLSTQQREHILRQQLTEIRRELGELDGFGRELEELEQAIMAAGMLPEAQAHALKDLARLQKVPEASAEHSLIRASLETLVKLPWKVQDSPEIDIEAARRILDADHYGLGKVKQRILEYLAVLKLNPEGRSPILCFVGPPGVGKTSLGQSIARALGRRFGRLSLGGVHDEAEIRGHRRTYIGAMPGSIMKTIERVGARDCVLMLDEIDKLGTGVGGDPSAALLEVLDPAQNDTFRDNYLDVPFDLSKVAFIATANILDTVPRPLLDRMEVIELSGYTQEEKLQIASRYLVKRQLKANGLTTTQCRINKSALKVIIDGYTRESGVRNLEREIGTVARRVAVLIAEGEVEKLSVNADDIERLLGAPRFVSEIALRTSMPGVATGLAWTPVGGDILFIESTKYIGKGRLLLTGQLGDVMRESAQAALSLLRARAAGLAIDPDIFEKADVHLHVPAGAIPKDGPSAGVAMFLSLVSLFRGECIRSDTAVTGELSLRGLVLPVGGIKEKVIAADRAGVKRVCLPAGNRRDFDDIPDSTKKRLDFIWLETVDDALRAALDAC